MKLLNTYNRDKAGFSMVEIIIGLGIVAFLVSLGLVLSMDIYRGQLFSSEIKTVVSLLQTARTRAVVNINQSPHGVYFEGDKYILFQGSVFNPMDPNNEEVPSSTMVSHTNPFEIVFEQLTGDSSVAGTIIFNGQGKTASISFNHEGLINW